ncbi:branched-chain amino acid ABC transporter permease [Nisaea acidiphila]|uniref:Branched-chain amino acid ABC transporter permease n=1 Tax=Nisaea acidiphila TaxID=1862145 RepID=A0A9J7ATV5_9PROT|nr:branched-chain amino acid ABC transporter permease [Nisaea acidiphila]UUX49921.1 branched-chain amino acid ABC transporter permease [Nisaea acidiphila]
MKTSAKPAGVLVLLIAASCVPFIADGYWLSIAVTIVMYTALSTSWALFSGPTHLIALSTGAFYGVGGYLVATGMSDFGASFWTMAALAPLAALLLAGAIGVATLRLSGVYFVIFTLGLAEMIRNLVSWVQNNFLGSRGLYVLTELEERHIYWMLLAVTAAIFLFGWRLGRSRMGFALRILGNDEEVARHVGIDTARTKILLFMSTGFFAALVGAIVAPRYYYIEPNVVFSPELSFLVVIMALLGGTRHLWGPLLGVVPFTLLWETVSATFPNATTMMLGVAFLAIVYLIPDGITGLAAKLKPRRLS